MTLDEAIKLLQKAVKWTGTIDQKHIDLTVIPAQERAQYEEALELAAKEIKAGSLKRDDFLRMVHLES